MNNKIGTSFLFPLSLSLSLFSHLWHTVRFVGTFPSNGQSFASRLYSLFIYAAH